LWKGEHGIEGREDTPKDGDEEEEAEPVLDIADAGMPPHGSS